MRCLYTPRNLIGKNFCNFKQSLKHSLGHKMSELKTSSFNVKQHMYIYIYIYICTLVCFVLKICPLSNKSWLHPCLTG